MFKKKSVIKEWFFSYVLILMVPLIAIFINYDYNIKTIEKEIQQANELVLNNLKDNVDSYLDDQRRMYFYFFNSDGFSNLVYSQDLDAEFYAEVREYCNQLNAYCCGNEKLTYWLYLEEQDYLISNKITGKSKTIYERQKTITTDFPEYTVWKEFLRGTYVNEYVINSNLLLSGAEDFLIFMNSFSYFGEWKANIFVTIPVSYIKQLTRTLPEGSLFLISFANEEKGTGEQLLAMDYRGVVELPEAVNLTEITGGGVFETGDYIALSKASDQSGVNYFLLIPKDTFWEEAGKIRNVHLTSILAVLLVGMVLVVFLLRRNFLPVTGILQMLDRDNQEGNEFERIKSAYGMIRKENHVMKNTMKSYKKSMCSIYLLALLKGRIGRDSKREQEIGWNPPDKNGMLALVGINIPLKEDAEEDELSFFIVDNVLTELFWGESFYYIEDGRILFYLFSIPEGKEKQWKAAVMEKTNYLCDFLEERIQLSLSVVISSPEKDVSRMKYMYQSVMETFEYRRIFGGNTQEIPHVRIAGYWKTEGGGIVSTIKELVETNYMDSSLNVSTIAAQMQKNPQYISKVFKSETGEGILDYINALRIRKAQEILQTRKISMEKVAEMVGYASVRTFRRSFAKVTGMTPSGYLEND